MNSLELITQQRQKEGKLLKVFLVSSLFASLAFHAGAMTLRVGNFWSNVPTLETEDEIEVTVVEDAPEEAIKENLLTDEPPPEPEIAPEVAFAPELAPPPIPLAPESQAPLISGEDAPSKESPSPTTDPVSPLTNSAGDTPAIGKAGSGPITSPDGKGSGFGNAARSSGFAPGGKPNGSPDGKPGGQVGGKPGGEAGQTAVRTAPSASAPAKPQQPVCVSCPKPKYPGKEASPRVDLKIRPDGSVEVQLRKSSGNPDLDRATLETMSKWRFDPKTVPQEGIRKRVRVTYEEEGSNFQRQNEQRRRQETEHRQIAEQEQQRRAVEQPSKAPASAVIETSAPKPASAENPAPAKDPAPAENSTPVENLAPAPISSPPVPEPAPSPVYEPPPAPVSEPPPAPVETPAPAAPNN